MRVVKRLCSIRPVTEELSMMRCVVSYLMTPAFVPIVAGVTNAGVRCLVEAIEHRRLPTTTCVVLQFS